MNPFLTACQGTEPIRLLIRRGHDVSEIAFDRAAVLIGRDGRADLNLLDSDVGSRHMYLQILRGRLYGVQLADRSETRSQGRPWLGGWIHPGQEFEIGRVTIRVLGPPQPETLDHLFDENPLIPDRSLEPYYALEPLSSRTASPRRFEYRQELLLAGRSAPCRLVVRHPDVSRCHAAIVRTPSSLWIVDLLSRTGVTVNGVPVASAEIRVGDRIEFGRVGVRVVLPGMPSGEPPRPPGLLLGTELSVPSVSDRAMDPVLDQFAALQQQTFDHFQELLATMMQMVGNVLNEQRQFVREELDRIERIVTSGQPLALQSAPDSPPEPLPTELTAAPPTDPAVTPRPPVDTPPPRAPAPSHPVDEVQLHAWLEQQLGSMNRQQSAAWDRLVRMFRGQ
jgi:hypothetical protein